MTNYNALSLFSGIGGFCEGVKLAGFNVVGASELDRYASKSYRANFPEIPLFEGDVADLLVAGSPVYEEHLHMYANGGKIDLLFGGPPCQGFSQIGPRDPLDPRNELYLQLCRIADQLRPRAILMENVPNMILMKKGMFKERIINALRSIGYANIALIKLCADQYGVPQSRNRVFILAFDDEASGLPIQGIVENVAIGARQAEVTVDEALLDLPCEVASDSGVVLSYPKSNNRNAFLDEMRVDRDGLHYCSKEKYEFFDRNKEKLALHNHHTKNVLERRKKLIMTLKPGQKASSLPKEMWDNKRPEKWRRFDGAKPAHTLLANMHRDLSEWIHPSYDRWITVREAMRLQGFHDGFVLKTSEWQQLKQVGNAVPPFLGAVPAIAIDHVLRLIDGKETDTKLAGQLALL